MFSNTGRSSYRLYQYLFIQQMLNITVLPVDNLPPILIPALVGELEVPEGGIVRLPPTLLGVTDPDTPSSRLKVTLVVPPVYGFITTDSNGGSRD